MNTSYILALFEQTARETALCDAASTVARSMVSDSANDLDVASPFASIRTHQNFFRRLAGLTEFPMTGAR